MGNRKFDDELKGKFLTHYEIHGRKSHAADWADVNKATVWRAEKTDADFKKAVKLSWLIYCDNVLEEAQRQMLGVPEPIMGGPLGTKVVAIKLKFPWNPLLQMEMIRCFAEFRSKRSKNLNLSGEHGGTLIFKTQEEADAFFKEHTAEYINGLTKKGGEHEVE